MNILIIIILILFIVGIFAFSGKKIAKLKMEKNGLFVEIESCRADITQYITDISKLIEENQNLKKDIQKKDECIKNWDKQ